MSEADYSISKTHDEYGAERGKWKVRFFPQFGRNHTKHIDGFESFEAAMEKAIELNQDMQNGSWDVQYVPTFLEWIVQIYPEVSFKALNELLSMLDEQETLDLKHLIHKKLAEHFKLALESYMLPKSDLAAILQLVEEG